MSDDTYDFTAPAAPAQKPAPSTPAAPLATEKEPSVLEKLRAEVSKKVERPEIVANVPERPAITIRFSPNVTQHQLSAWRRNAGDNTKQGMDGTKFACYVVGHTCRGIMIDGQEVLGEEGAPLTFASPEILEMLDVTKPIPDAVQAMYGLDPHVEAAALVVLEAAGYSDSVDTVDPTQG
jgi:hypothetical protein